MELFRKRCLPTDPESQKHSSFWLLILQYFTISNIYLMLNVYFCSDPLPACLPCRAGVYNSHTACEVTADSCRRTLIFTDYPDMLAGLTSLHQILIFWTVTGPCSRDINATGPCNSSIQATVAVVTLHGRQCNDGHFTLFNSSIPKNPLVSFLRILQLFNNKSNLNMLYFNNRQFYNIIVTIDYDKIQTNVSIHKYI